jgi:hypothetical protein
MTTWTYTWDDEVLWLLADGQPAAYADLDPTTGEPWADQATAETWGRRACLSRNMPDTVAGLPGFGPTAGGMTP